MEDSFDTFLNQSAKSRQINKPVSETEPAKLKPVLKELAETTEFTQELGDFTQDKFIEAQKDLTFVELDFLNEYLKNGGNGARAYLTVNKTAKYTQAAYMASMILKKKNVKSFLQLFKNAQLERFQITIESQLSEIEEFIESCKADPTMIDRTNWMKAIQEKSKLAGLVSNAATDVKSSRSIEIVLNLEPDTKPIDITPTKDSNHLEDSNNSDDID